MKSQKLSTLQKAGRFSTTIRKHLREEFYREPRKGALVNDLLEIRYDMVSDRNRLVKKAETGKSEAKEADHERGSEHN